MVKKQRGGGMHSEYCPLCLLSYEPLPDQTRIGTATKPMPFNAHTLTTWCAKSRATRHLFCEFSQHYEPKPPKTHSKHIASHSLQI